MVPDSEILCILVEALTALDIGEFTVKVRSPLPFFMPFSSRWLTMPERSRTSS